MRSHLLPREELPKEPVSQRGRGAVTWPAELDLMQPRAHVGWSVSGFSWTCLDLLISWWPLRERSFHTCHSEGFGAYVRLFPSCAPESPQALLSAPHTGEGSHLREGQLRERVCTLEGGKYQESR